MPQNQNGKLAPSTRLLTSSEDPSLGGKKRPLEDLEQEGKGAGGAAVGKVPKMLEQEGKGAGGAAVGK
eukprot:987632-Prorocentrum_minimum.AAC.1